MTSTTELRTDVCLSDVIQKAKCAASIAPASAMYFQCAVGIRRSLPPRVADMIGNKTSVAIVKRAAAMTSGGASVESLMKIAAEEIDSTPIASTKGRWNRRLMGRILPDLLFAV